VSSKPIFNAGTERFIRDWRSSIVTVTVRDQRYREHDPILGVVPLKLSDIFENRSQVTRWYPLDGGIGFGRIRISLLFRSVETRLPPNMLGWDVGTFEFTSDRITAQNYVHHAKIKLRTGGSIGRIPRGTCHWEGNGAVFDLTQRHARHGNRLPVKHRYRSPVVFEFHIPHRRGAAAYAVLWLQHLVDNEETPIDIPIWTTKNGNRLTQNYITEQNWKAKLVPGLEDLTEVGRLQFTARFSPGIDESHEHFVMDNDSRETYETWEACLSEGVRNRTVEVEMSEEVRDLHEKSLLEGRNVLKQADPEERQRWIAKDGTDWSGAFGHDPRAYTDSKGRKVAEPGRDKPRHDPVCPPPICEKSQPRPGTENAKKGRDAARKDLDNGGDGSSESSGESTGSEEQSLSDLATTATATSQSSSSSSSKSKGEEEAAAQHRMGKKANRRTEQRKQRGLMQWKAARNAVFAKDEAKFALRKVRQKLGGDLTGREPDIETETGK